MECKMKRRTFLSGVAGAALALIGLKPAEAEAEGSWLDEGVRMGETFQLTPERPITRVTLKREETYGRAPRQLYRVVAITGACITLEYVGEESDEAEWFRLTAHSERVELHAPSGWAGVQVGDGVTFDPATFVATIHPRRIATLTSVHDGRLPVAVPAIGTAFERPFTTVVHYADYGRGRFGHSRFSNPLMVSSDGYRWDPMMTLRFD